MLKYQNCLFGWSGILRASMWKKKTVWGTLAFREVSLLFLWEARSLAVQRQATLLLWRQISGVGRRAAEYKRFRALNEKGSILLRLLVICKGKTMIQRVHFQFGKKAGDLTQETEDSSFPAVLKWQFWGNFYSAGWVKVFGVLLKQRKTNTLPEELTRWRWAGEISSTDIFKKLQGIFLNTHSNIKLLLKLVSNIFLTFLLPVCKLNLYEMQLYCCELKCCICTLTLAAPFTSNLHFT